MHQTRNKFKFIGYYIIASVLKHLFLCGWRRGLCKNSDILTEALNEYFIYRSYTKTSILQLNRNVIYIYTQERIMPSTIDKENKTIKMLIAKR